MYAWRIHSTRFSDTIPWHTIHTTIIVTAVVRGIVYDTFWFGGNIDISTYIHMHTEYSK